MIAGAGWIGLEVAAAAREYGAEVTVVEPGPTPLHGVLGPELGSVFAELHEAHGVRFRFGVKLTEIIGQDGMVLAARTDDGEEHPAHDVLAAIGAAPRTALAQAAGLEIADRAHGGGIVVDANLRTSDPDIHAAGDVASFHHALFDTSLRVEHWANALNGGPAAARAMLGRGLAHDRVPYFFTDQYDLGMEYSGWRPRVVRPGGDPRGRGEARVHRLLGEGGRRTGRDERERVGRHGADPAADPLEDPGGHGGAGEPARIARKPRRVAVSPSPAPIPGDDPRTPGRIPAVPRRTAASRRAGPPGQSPSPGPSMSVPPRRLHAWLDGSTTRT